MRTIDPEFKKLGRRLKLLRKSRGITQGEMAEKLGVSQTVICGVERGKMCATLRRLYQLRDILGCEMRDFFEEEATKVAGEIDVTLEEVVQAIRVMKKINLAEARED